MQTQMSTPLTSTNHSLSEIEGSLTQACREELAGRIGRAIRTDGIIDPLEGLRLRRASAPTELGHGVSYPSFCVIA